MPHHWHLTSRPQQFNNVSISTSTLHQLLLIFFNLIDMFLPFSQLSDVLVSPLQVDINYADICDPVLNGPAAEQQCKETPKK